MTELSADAQQKVLELTKGYINSFPEKITQLEACWRNVEDNQFAADSLDALRNLSHKLAGSSGSYNLLDISKAAKLVEQMSTAKQWQQTKKDTREDALKSCFQNLIKLLQKQG